MERVKSIDALRGLVVVLMTLDHTRDFVSNIPFDPLDPDKTNYLIYFTRWITHLCAPVFVLLAGISVWLWERKGRSKSEVSKYLLTRGIGLVFLELTVVWWLGWDFSFTYNHFYLGVIWAIGWSLIALGFLIWFPLAIIFTISFLMIAGHNALDAINPSSLGKLEIPWRFLHVSSSVKIAGIKFDIGYPLIPWIGVLALGYCLGPMLRLRAFFKPGLVLLIIFSVLRASNVYGDPMPWTDNFLSFLNVTKYPPSLLYLLVTLGMGFLFWGIIDKYPGRVTEFLNVFGRVPLFFYIVHLPLLHLIAVILSLAVHGKATWLFGFCSIPGNLDKGPERGFDLWVVYAVWIMALAMMYPACVWFWNFKLKRKQGTHLVKG